eukprot:scaffold237899_cov18-Prasinocladus_malaysianus.AAC.1
MSKQSSTGLGHQFKACTMLLLITAVMSWFDVDSSVFARPSSSRLMIVFVLDASPAFTVHVNFVKQQVIRPGQASAQRGLACIISQIFGSRQVRVRAPCVSKSYLVSGRPGKKKHEPNYRYCS